MRARRRTLLSGLLCAVLGMALAGCSEAGPVDDGTYSSLQAGAPDILAGLGIALVSLEQPAAATPDDVVAALADERLDAEAYPVVAVAGVALDPERVAGLLGLAGNGESSGKQAGRYLILSFNSLEAAVVFAQGDPEIFEDPDVEADRAAYFSGNLVAYYAPKGKADATDRFRAALDALAGN